MRNTYFFRFLMTYLVTTDRYIATLSFFYYAGNNILKYIKTRVTR